MVVATMIEAMSNVLNGLKTARLKAGLTQNDVAAMVGDTQSNYAAFEGGSRPYSKKRIEVIANALGINQSQLLAWMLIDEYGEDVFKEALNIVTQKRGLKK